MQKLAFLWHITALRVVHVSPRLVCRASTELFKWCVGTLASMTVWRTFTTPRLQLMHLDSLQLVDGSVATKTGDSSVCCVVALRCEL
jgi:hypothetical protein